MPRDPTSPLRAHHRMMRELLPSKDVAATPEELDRVSRVFTRAGGSWEGVFDGSIDDMALLKKCLKVAADKGFLTKPSDWSA